MELADLEKGCEVTAGNPHIGSSLEDFFKEDDIQEAIDRLKDYEIARDQEEAAQELSKTYTRRRQAAFQAYLKAYDALSESNISEETKRVIDSRLYDLRKKA